MIPTLRLIPIMAAILAVVLVSAAPAGDTIDFSKPPAAGAKFKVTELSNFLVKANIDAGGRSFETKSTITGKEVFTHKILEVKEGKIVKVERSYEDAGSKQVTEAPMFPEPQEQEQESPLAWKVIQGSWVDDAFELTVKDGDDWKEAEEKISSKVTSHSLRSPLLPLPDGEKSVGDSWELDSDELKKYFPSEQFGGSAESSMDGEYRATLKSIEEVDGLEYGVIEFELKIQVETGEGPAMSFNLKGTAHYSIQHHFILKMKAEGKMNSEYEGEQQGVAISQKLDGDIKVTATATPVKDEE